MPTRRKRENRATTHYCADFINLFIFYYQLHTKPLATQAVRELPERTVSPLHLLGRRTSIFL